MAIRHSKVSEQTSSLDASLIQPPDWNADHELDGVLGLFLDVAPTPNSFPYVKTDGSPGMAYLSEPARTLIAGLTMQIIRETLGAASLDSPHFTGAPTAPTSSILDASTRVATMEALKAMRDSILGAAPSQLDALNELAAALNNDPDFYNTMATALGNRLRVDAVQGLSNSQKAQGRANLAILSAALYDVGVAAGNVLQLNGASKIPAVDGSLLTGIVAAWANVSGKPSFGTAATIDVGTTANKILQLDGSAKIPAVDGSQLTGIVTPPYTNGAAPTAPAAGKTLLYTDANKLLRSKDDAGVDRGFSRTVSVTVVANGAATVDIPIPAEFASLDFIIEDLMVNTNSAQVSIRGSSDGGATYPTGSNEYLYQINISEAAMTVSQASNSAIPITSAVDTSQPAHGISGHILIVPGMPGSSFPSLQTRVSCLSSGNISARYVDGRRQTTTTRLTHLRFFPSAGTFTRGAIRLIGYS